MAGLTTQLALHLNKKSQVVEEETGHLIVKPHSAVIYSMIHALSSRVEFYIPRISLDSRYMQRLLTLFACEPWIISQQVNDIARSIVMTYKSATMLNSQKRSLSLLEQAISYLSSPIQSAASDSVVPIS
ncbi:MAG: hypothetical protein KME30_03610 [Iphinoe sp. HA4291-MV1]|jgi:hypothetical protein|nr:hypothetical protein [Iphinoe sp. HA4291-MV1]